MLAAGAAAVHSDIGTIRGWNVSGFSGREPMSDAKKSDETSLGRRDFLKGAVVGGAVAATGATAVPQEAAAQAAAPANPGYAHLNLEEAAFVEALVDHMIPADEHSPKGTDVGINIFIDRALGGAWGK